MARTVAKSLVVAAGWLTTAAVAQTIYPSNDTDDLLPAQASPRYLLNSSAFSHIPTVNLAPLGPYTDVNHRGFVSTDINGKIIPIDASNANQDFSVDMPNFFYMSCDPQDYASGNIPANEVFRIAINNNDVHTIILYSRTSDYCAATQLEDLPEIFAVMTTLSPSVARDIAALRLSSTSPAVCTLLPDLNSYSNASGNTPWMNGQQPSSWGSKSPTTAVAMIILYSITGLITALFVAIIVTGAIRAHRNPGRYGPRNVIGRGRQSRAKGLARAMLDTIPIVKFGDRDGDAGAGGTAEAQKTPPPDSAREGDIEMVAGAPKESGGSEVAKDVSAKGHTPATTTTEILPTPIDETPTHQASVETIHSTTVGAVKSPPSAVGIAAATADPHSAADASASCSICTEDFTLGSDVRVLPCDHQFHPECVDPWLLNISGTCPLCRIDLRPPTSASNPSESGEGAEAETMGSGSSTEAGAGAAESGRPMPVAAGYRPGEDFIMAGSLRSGRSRRTSQGPASGGGVSGRRWTNGNTALPAAAGGGSLNGTEGGAFAGLRRALASGSREERVAALRAFSAQQRQHSPAAATSAGSETPVAGGADEQQRSLTHRLRERLLVRTERREGGGRSATSTPEGTRLTLGQVRSREHVDGRPL